MQRQFLCLKCGHVTRPVAEPVRCARCGGGSGVIEPAQHEREGEVNGEGGNAKASREETSSRDF